MFFHSIIPFISVHLHWIVVEGLAWLHMPTTKRMFKSDPDIVVLSPQRDHHESRLLQSINLHTAYIVQTVTSALDCEKLLNHSNRPVLITNGWNDEIRELLLVLQKNYGSDLPFLVMAEAHNALLGSLAEDAIHSGAQTFIPWSLGTAPLLAYLHRLLEPVPSSGCSAAERIKSTHISINHKARIVNIDDQKIYLPSNLYALFCCMVQNPGEALSYQQLTQALKNGRKVFIAPNTLVVKVYRLRRLFEHTGLHHWMETVPGFGYRYSGPKIHIMD
ncbi:winged helix-turn-helix domain-containing protein [Acidithiobacillus thiooxidans]|uniref:winged helix-turn-helix domain-containing protein n=1 Tax=Acidithiobacillus thiooxidans TaxID=930 RepID=UPI00285654F8|nr:winged helix-turn-helix domain-containing protein [Acidithiobacillus thiooxidans]MDR7925464.1 winged helix-turn-helix domain-containing protein [Acidithiobacillus thiooxidans]